MDLYHPALHCTQVVSVLSAPEQMALGSCPAWQNAPSRCHFCPVQAVHTASVDSVHLFRYAPVCPTQSGSLHFLHAEVSRT